MHFHQSTGLFCHFQVNYASDGIIATLFHALAFLSLAGETPFPFCKVYSRGLIYTECLSSFCQHFQHRLLPFLGLFLSTDSLVRGMKNTDSVFWPFFLSFVLILLYSGDSDLSIS